ncbi:immunoglobulin superfamily member 3-like [Hirundo rustica]|uniref:immunoglobulin superfamily member 3-like n=1 Tax=Hirundo rustica TaxID=43150 RepID=UPI001A94F499|nr:immunoglobulin superfamily member 3-like [Hirundo rustica]
MVPCCFLVAVLAPLVVALEQSPDMVIKEGQSVNLECSQKKSSSTAMYWFMRPSGKNSSLTLLASAIERSNAAVEKGFESHFKSSDIKGDSITLTIERAFLNDSGTYYCAEGEHSAAISDFNLHSTEFPLLNSSQPCSR